MFFISSKLCFCAIVLFVMANNSVIIVIDLNICFIILDIVCAKLVIFCGICNKKITKNIGNSAFFSLFYAQKLKKMHYMLHISKNGITFAPHYRER